MSVPSVHNELLSLSSPLKYLGLAPEFYTSLFLGGVLERPGRLAWGLLREWMFQPKDPQRASW